MTVMMLMLLIMMKVMKLTVITMMTTLIMQSFFLFSLPGRRPLDNRQNSIAGKWQWSWLCRGHFGWFLRQLLSLLKYPWHPGQLENFTNIQQYLAWLWRCLKHVNYYDINYLILYGPEEGLAVWCVLLYIRMNYCYQKTKFLTCIIASLYLLK